MAEEKEELKTEVTEIAHVESTHAPVHVQQLQPLTVHEKRKLKQDLLSLHPEKLAQVFRVIHQAQPQNISTNNDEMEIDLKKLNTRTLRHLQRYARVLLEPSAMMNNYNQAPNVTYYQPQPPLMNMQPTVCANLFKRYKPRKKRPAPDISAVDLKRMREICNRMDMQMNVNTQLYGYKTHRQVYEDILKMVQMKDDTERNVYVAKLKGNDCRDIKTKIYSDGKTGRKVEMMIGIRSRLKELRQCYIEDPFSPRIQSMSPKLDVPSAPE